MGVINSGIYLISHEGLPVYVGASTDLRARLEYQRSHFSMLLNDDRRKTAGIELRVLEFVEIDRSNGKRVFDHPQLVEREKAWIKQIKPLRNKQHSSTAEAVDISKLPVGEP